MRGALSRLEGGWRPPSVAGLRALGASDSLTFSSHAWTISLDPVTGVTACCARGPRHYTAFMHET
jgi:hypothetical protein